MLDVKVNEMAVSQAVMEVKLDMFKKSMEDMKSTIDQHGEILDRIDKKLAQAEGGWKMILLFGGIVGGSVGGSVMHVVHLMTGK